MIADVTKLRERLTQSDWIVCAEVVRLLDEASRSASCGVISMSGPNGEPLACGYYAGHDGPHAWSTLPTWAQVHPERAFARFQMPEGHEDCRYERCTAVGRHFHPDDWNHYWSSLTDEQRQAVKDKASWEHMSLSAVAAAWGRADGAS